VNTTETKTNLVAWDGNTYKGAGAYYDQFKNDPEFLEYTQDLTEEEILRLALYSYNGSWQLVSEDMPLLIAQEQDSYRGESESTAEFTREIIEEMGYVSEDMPSWIVIDYETTWKSALRFDFFEYQVIDTDGNYRNFFWYCQ
jgi:hypothetical protein